MTEVENLFINDRGGIILDREGNATGAHLTGALGQVVVMGIGTKCYT